MVNLSSAVMQQATLKTINAGCVNSSVTLWLCLFNAPLFFFFFLIFFFIIYLFIYLFLLKTHKL